MVIFRPKVADDADISLPALPSSRPSSGRASAPAVTSLVPDRGEPAVQLHRERQGRGLGNRDRPADIAPAPGIPRRSRCCPGIVRTCARRRSRTRAFSRPPASRTASACSCGWARWEATCGRCMARAISRCPSARSRTCSLSHRGGHARRERRVPARERDHQSQVRSRRPRQPSAAPAAADNPDHIDLWITSFYAG